MADMDELFTEMLATLQEACETVGSEMEPLSQAPTLTPEPWLFWTSRFAPLLHKPTPSS